MADAVVERSTLQSCLYVINSRVLCAPVNELHEVGVHLVLPFIEILPETTRDGSLVEHDERIGKVP